MARKTLKQEVIDEDFEEQFKVADYTRNLAALDSLAKKAEKLRKIIALTYVEAIDEHRDNRDAIAALETPHMSSYRQAKQAYFDAISLMGFYAHQISYAKTHGRADPAMQHPDISIDYVKQCLDILGGIYD